MAHIRRELEEEEDNWYVVLAEVEEDNVALASVGGARWSGAKFHRDPRLHHCP